MLMLLLGDAGPGSSVPVRARLWWLRSLALISTTLGLLIAALLVAQAAGGAVSVYRLGNWPAPFGIALVIDRLSALMLLLTSVIALPVLCYACAGWDSRGRHFHALLQFLLMGLNGAFVTGDLFNLFVFFEVLLIASYALVLHGLGAQRLQAGLHYVVLNLTASALFLIGAALVYAVTGTLNLADLALRAPRVMGAEATLLQVAGMVLFVVFAFKAALLPVAMWLPGTYTAASAPVAALFAIMTKVGVYALVRVHGVALGGFWSDDWLPYLQPALLPLALLSSVVAALGALAAQTLSRLVAWLLVASIGTIVAGIGLFTAAAWSAALYYMLHSTVVVAALFLLCELIAAQRGHVADRLQPAVALLQPTLIGLLVLLAAACALGLPPLPGFIGKLMLLQASGSHLWAVWVWSAVLIVSFLGLLAWARAGSVLFWNTVDGPPSTSLPAHPLRVLAAASLLAVSVAMSVWAEPIQHYTAAAVDQLLDRAAYAQAILPEQGGVEAHTARPYPAPAVLQPGGAP